MPIWIQHLLILLLLTICVAVVAWQGVRALAGKRSKLGACCAKGCGSADGAAAPVKPQAKRIAFLPAEMLRPKR